MNTYWVPQYQPQFVPPQYPPQFVPQYQQQLAPTVGQFYQPQAPPVFQQPVQASPMFQQPTMFQQPSMLHAPIVTQPFVEAPVVVQPQQQNNSLGTPPVVVQQQPQPSQSFVTTSAEPDHHPQQHPKKRQRNNKNAEVKRLKNRRKILYFIKRSRLLSLFVSVKKLQSKNVTPTAPPESEMVEPLTVPALPTATAPPTAIEPIKPEVDIPKPWSWWPWA